jgi:large subunit ribosomal protein L7e
MSSSEVPVSHAKKQEIQLKIATILKSQKEELSKRVEANKQYSKLMTEKILKEFNAEKTEEAKLMKSTTEVFVPAESNFFVAIQLRSQVKIAPRPKKTLSLLRLNQINTCVVLRNNQSIKKMLQNAKDYIAFGSISYDLLRKLIYTRGFGKINGNKVKLTNENIEESFNGKFKCIEELCDVIYHGKDDIRDVLKFLCPFRLCPPKGGFPNGHKKRDFIQGGSSNDHKHLLGDLLEKMI